MTVKIPLTKGKYAVINREYLPKISRYSWHATSHGYAAARIGDQIIYMHRYITNAPNGEQVDHIDRDRLNNTEDNLRLVSESQNKMNRPGRKKIEGATSDYKGVYFDKSREKWAAMIMFDGTRKHLGRFDDEKDAAIAYNKASIKYHGEYGFLNEL